MLVDTIDTNQMSYADIGEAKQAQSFVDDLGYNTWVKCRVKADMKSAKRIVGLIKQMGVYAVLLETRSSYKKSQGVWVPKVVSRIKVYKDKPSLAKRMKHRLIYPQLYVHTNHDAETFHDMDDE